MRLNSLIVILLLGGCDCSSTCVGELCEGVDGGRVGDAEPGDQAADLRATDGSSPNDSTPVCIECEGTCCEAGERCSSGGCMPDLGSCTSNDECVSDSYCAADGLCTPFGVPVGTERNDECVLDGALETISPAVQCAFTTPPPGDPYPNHDDVQGTPVVVDFDFDNDPATLRPSIIFQSAGGAGEVLRVIDGRTCELQHNVSDAMAYASSVAVGDLDGDGRSEIVGVRNDRLTAWRYDTVSSRFVILWEAASCDGGRTPFVRAHTLVGPSIHDLDDDGLIEIISSGAIVDARDGCVLASASVDLFDFAPVIADVDEDGEAEIISADGIFRFDRATASIVMESYSAGTHNAERAASVAVGDFGVFPVAAFGGADRAEIVGVAEGHVWVETIEGTRLLTAELASGRGGPPTVADFDGDGRAEFALAARREYVVYDLDCLPGGSAEHCGGATRSDGRLWSVEVNEESSGLTGSSVFDFNADGQAEVIYHDECFLRIFNGGDGTVLYSFPRSSLTWLEMPIVVDADGDFHSEIVMGAHEFTGEGCSGADRYRPDVTFMPTHGIYVLRDVLDRWATSRPIWNQHAYSITHVGDHGEIPRTRDVPINWRTTGLDNFRQNVQGDLEPLGIADLTSHVRGVTPLQCGDGVATVSAQVCNRGRLPLGGGLIVAFRAGALDGPEFCRTTIEASIDIGTCVEISCSTAEPAGLIDLYIVPDPDDLVTECHESNSWGRLNNVACVH